MPKDAGSRQLRRQLGTARVQPSWSLTSAWQLPTESNVPCPLADAKPTLTAWPTRSRSRVVSQISFQATLACPNLRLSCFGLAELSQGFRSFGFVPSHEFFWTHPFSLFVNGVTDHTDLLDYGVVSPGQVLHVILLLSTQRA